MSTTYDTIVIGLGGMGSAAVYQLAGRGSRVLGLERHTPGHNLGSSHGQSRVTRQAYFEDPAYVPLLLRAYELWEEVERATGRDLLTITGGLMMGAPDSHVVLGSIRSAQEYSLYHEVLDAREIARRYPPFTPPADVIALYERKAGLLRPEECVRTHLDEAARLGADLHFEEPVVEWTAAPGGDGVTVRTAQGTYEAGRLVISPGPWAADLLADMQLPLEVERQVMYWFAPTGGIEPFLPDRFPIYIWETEPGVEFYGFPAHEGPQGGVKVAFYRAPGARGATTPSTIDRTVHPAEVDQIRTWIADRVPSLNGEFLYAKTCMYTNTPDAHFVIAIHPHHSQVAVAAGFSGHGFKFASVVGEILADLALDGATRHPIALFAPDRPVLQPGGAA